MCVAEFRKLALEFADANKIQNPFNKTKKQTNKKKASPDSSKPP
jgi:hypothetical protein